MRDIFKILGKYVDDNGLLKEGDKNTIICDKVLKELFKVNEIKWRISHHAIECIHAHFRKTPIQNFSKNWGGIPPIQLPPTYITHF